jgi:thioredoxin reductase (NADPH)
MRFAPIKIRKMASQETIYLPVKGVFVAIGLKLNSELISHLTAVNPKGEIIINSDCSTSCPGVFAAGDRLSGWLDPFKPSPQ